MPSLNDQVAQFEAALAALAAQRPALGDAVVDITLATLRAQLDALRQPSSSSPLAGMGSLGGQLDQLRQAELIQLCTSQPELEYIFKHALTQHAAYDSMLYATRDSSHRRPDL